MALLCNKRPVSYMYKAAHVDRISIWAFQKVNGTFPIPHNIPHSAWEFIFNDETAI